MRTLYLAIPVIVLAPLMGGCASTSAKGKPSDRPAMNVPPPPPRVIEPTPEPPPEPVSDLPNVPASNSGPSRAPRPASPKPEARTEPPAEVPKIEAAKPAEEKEASAPVPQLRTPQTADASGAARNVLATVERASTMLSGVDYGPLSNNRKKAYNDAKRFIRQAEDGLKRGNYAFAQGVATKAETLARELSGK